jgi:hypothetical protein
MATKKIGKWVFPHLSYYNVEPGDVQELIGTPLAQQHPSSGTLKIRCFLAVKTSSKHKKLGKYHFQAIMMAIAMESPQGNVSDY